MNSETGPGAGIDKVCPIEAECAPNEPRRSFLRAGAACLVGCAAGLAAPGLAGCGAPAGPGTQTGAGGSGATASKPAAAVSLVAAVEGPDGTFTLPGAAALKKGAALVFDAKNQGPVVVFLTAAGKLEALSARCTHAGCTVEFVPAGRDRLHCPCHNSRFDEKGKVLGGPATLPLTSFAITAKGSDAVVVVPA